MPSLIFGCCGFFQLEVGAEKASLLSAFRLVHANAVKYLSCSVAAE